MIFEFITKNLLGAFPKFSSVTMPASLPLQLWKIPPKSSFVIKSFKSKHTLTLTSFIGRLMNEDAHYEKHTIKGRASDN